MKIVLGILIFVSITFLSSIVSSQSNGIGFSEVQTSSPHSQADTAAGQQLDLDLIKESSIGVGSGEIVFLRGSIIGNLAEGFLKEENKNHDDALQNTLTALFPLLGDLRGRIFKIDKVINLSAQRLVRFHQAIEGARLPTSNIYANKEGEIQSVSLYSIAPQRTKSDFDKKLPDTELSRLFEYHASKYFESLGAQRVIDENSATGPALRYLVLDTNSGLQYRYVADFFYDGFVFVLDAKSGELVKGGFMGVVD